MITVNPPQMRTEKDLRDLERELAYFESIANDRTFNEWTSEIDKKIEVLTAERDRLVSRREIAPMRITELKKLIVEAELSIATSKENTKIVKTTSTKVRTQTIDPRVAAMLKASGFDPAEVAKMVG